MAYSKFSRIICVQLSLYKAGLEPGTSRTQANGEEIRPRALESYHRGACCEIPIKLLSSSFDVRVALNLGFKISPIFLFRFFTLSTVRRRRLRRRPRRRDVHRRR